MKKVLIYGLGKMAEFIYYSFLNDSDYEVLGFCADDSYVYSGKVGTLFGCPVLSATDAFQKYPPGSCLMHIAIGRNDAREIIFNKALSLGYEFANYVCSKANVWPDLITGQNVFIDQASNIHPYVSIGDNCILIGARIGHHSSVGSHSLLSGTSLSGNVTIGQGSFLGLNSCIKEGIRVGARNIVGAGCFIRKDTADQSLIYQSQTVQRIASSRNIVLFDPGSGIKKGQQMST